MPETMLDQVAAAATMTDPPRRGRPPKEKTEEASNKPDPFKAPAEYLLANDWKPLGPTDSPFCKWLDPMKPIKGFYSKESKFIKRTIKNDAGQFEVVTEQVMGQFGKGAQDKRPVVQHIWNPPGVPLGMQDALQEQMERDHAEILARAS